jgi:transposase InsO family protein
MSDWGSLMADTKTDVPAECNCLAVRQAARYITQVYDQHLAAAGLRRPTRSRRSPWQNGYAERLIGSIRRECLDHLVVVGERHLRHVLASYQKY